MRDQSETIEHLKAKAYRLKMANDFLLGLVAQMSGMLYDKFEADEARYDEVFQQAKNAADKSWID